MANSFFYGLTKDNKLVGGDTMLGTPKKELFEWFKERDCVVGVVGTHWECGFVNKTAKTWWGDETLKEELEKKIKEYYE
jgi:hypothetical protein